MTAPVPFDVYGPLPGPGTTVLEASAGTGKTFALTTLVTRFVADGVPLSAILAITFTRMATGELRDRIRQQLVSTEDRLRRHLHGGEPIAAADRLVAGLADGPRPLVVARHQRLADAVATFDAATVATTHSFCQLVLSGLGSAGDVPAGAGLLEEPTDLVRQVVDDLYLRRALLDGPLPFSRSAAVAAATEAVANPDVEIAPPAGDDPAGLLGRLAAKARSEVARRLQEANLLTYDQLLFRLAGTLCDSERGQLACARLRQRYEVVLVDEFQDTDPIQWRAVRTAFGGGGTRLVLVGDPKQAVYAFRGADVYAYLDAAQAPDTRLQALAENWRSDQPLLDALEALLSPLQLGHEAIEYRAVTAPTDRREAGTRGVPAAAPLRVRLVDSRQPGIPRTPSRHLLGKGPLIEWIAGDVAADVAVLLASGAEVVDPEERTWRPLRPADVAVLTRTNRQSQAVRDALRRAGVAAVVAGLDSVFAAPAARHWLHLLDALQEPASRARAVALALTPFVGWSPADVAIAPERRWAGLHEAMHRWKAALADHGVAALYRTVTTEQGLPARVLASAGGERLLTDLGHLAQLLHAEAATTQLGVSALRAWLCQRIAEPGEQANADERSRRLDSDADAVTVLTVHRAKGLEFAVVYCPYLWDSPVSHRAPAPVIFHDPDDQRRVLDVGCGDKDGPARRRYDTHVALAKSESRGEDLRLLYVAVTRARHHVVLWWAQASDSRHSVLGRLLLCRDLATGALRDARPGEPRDRDVRAALDTLAARARPGLVVVEAAGSPSPAASGAVGAPGAAPAAGELRTARFDRHLDLRWRRASYTSITAPAHDRQLDRHVVGSEPEEAGVGDEPPVAAGPPVPAGPPAAADVGVPSLLGGVPGGTEVGTSVHRILERVDFASPHLEAELLALARDQASVASDPGALAGGLAAALATPLGPLLPGVCLRDVTRHDRLDELGFELPLAGGDRPVEEVTTADIAALLAAHLPAGGPLAGYADRLADPVLATSLRGYLTGSLDLVFRRASTPGGDPRWYVADYKTNWLGEPGRLLSTWHYRPEALDAEMQHRHYPLQALFYTVALHRYLRWRQPGYDPERHLGGVLYLFLRGMTGPASPEVDGQRCGVFSWAPAVELVTGLSDLLAAGPAAEEALV